MQKKKSGVKKCLEILPLRGGGVGPLMANAILNFHFDFLHPSLIWALWASEQKVEWMEWMDTPIDCYDYYSTCGANKCFVPIEHNLQRN